jgi:N-methylhydantoinase A
MARQRGVEKTSRSVYFRPGGVQETVILQRESLPVGETWQGPLIVEEDLSTTLIPPGSRLSVHESGSLVIELLKKEA